MTFFSTWLRLRNTFPYVFIRDVGFTISVGGMLLWVINVVFLSFFSLLPLWRRKNASYMFFWTPPPTKTFTNHFTNDFIFCTVSTIYTVNGLWKIKLRLRNYVARSLPSSTTMLFTLTLTLRRIRIRGRERGRAEISVNEIRIRMQHCTCTWARLLSPRKVSNNLWFPISCWYFSSVLFFSFRISFEIFW